MLEGIKYNFCYMDCCQRGLSSWLSHAVNPVICEGVNDWVAAVCQSSFASNWLGRRITVELSNDKQSGLGLGGWHGCFELEL